MKALLSIVHFWYPWSFLWKVECGFGVIKAFALIWTASVQSSVRPFNNKVLSVKTLKSFKCYKGQLLFQQCNAKVRLWKTKLSGMHLSGSAYLQVSCKRYMIPEVPSMCYNNCRIDNVTYEDFVQGVLRLPPLDSDEATMVGCDTHWRYSMTILHSWGGRFEGCCPWSKLVKVYPWESKGRGGAIPAPSGGGWDSYPWREGGGGPKRGWWWCPGGTGRHGGGPPSPIPAMLPSTRLPPLLLWWLYTSGECPTLVPPDPKGWLAL